MISGPLLSARGLSKSHFETERLDILRDVSIDVQPGQTVAILGSSGEGKTTLLHLLALLDTPTSGVIEMGGRIVDERRGDLMRRDFLAMVFQFYYLIEEWTVMENALLPASIAGDEMAASRTRCRRLLERVSLTSKLHVRAALLSGGEKQRLCLARALLRRPKLLLADEFTGNLDRANGKIVQDLLFEQVACEMSALVIATHDEELAARCQTRYRLSGGYLSELSS